MLPQSIQLTITGWTRSNNYLDNNHKLRDPNKQNRKKQAKIPNQSEHSKVRDQLSEQFPPEGRFIRKDINKQYIHKATKSLGIVKTVAQKEKKHKQSLQMLESITNGMLNNTLSIQ